jgi:pimeloyl-ACP methyl ester carboxylesterase
VWPGGRTRLVVVGGVGSRTGDAERAFAGMMRFLAERAGYHLRHDLLEATYAGRVVGERWEPRPYTPADTRQPLVDLADAVAGTLEWYRDVLPPETRFCVLGYSLGGVIALDAATLAAARDRRGWRERIAAVVTIASPVRGCNAGPFIQWAWIATADMDPLGVVGAELDRRWSDPLERERVERRAAFLRSEGAAVLTLADPDDAVVRPDEALLPAPGQAPGELLVRTDRVRPGSYGHGAILDEPATWRRVLEVIGPQQPLPGGQPGSAEDPIELELQAIKERLRAEGRL